MRIPIAMAAGCFLATAVSLGGEPAPFMMRATVAEQLVEGQPLAWNDSQMFLLGRDGALHEFHPAEAKDAAKFGRGFLAYTAQEMSVRLSAEFNRSFEVSTTAHFAVVHPRGPWSGWAQRLESLYGAFTHYLAVRGFRLAAPATPLVAVVFRTQDDYYRHAAASGAPLQPGTLGHYDPVSNRVFLFDAGPTGSDADWAANADTIIHEAAHQTAYNVGVHRRFAAQPRWAVEGLAMMFEARGVWDASPTRRQADRINAERLSYFLRTYEERSADWLAQLVASDARFDSDVLSAYAEAWTLTFYLCETRPQEYSGYLARVAAREAFSAYSPLERMGDFTSAFGGDLELLTAQVERFVEGLPFR